MSHSLTTGMMLGLLASLAASPDGYAFEKAGPGNAHGVTANVPKPMGLVRLKSLPLGEPMKRKKWGVEATVEFTFSLDDQGRVTSVQQVDKSSPDLGSFPKRMLATLKASVFESGARSDTAWEVRVGSAKKWHILFHARWHASFKAYTIAHHYAPEADWEKRRSRLRPPQQGALPFGMTGSADFSLPLSPRVVFDLKMPKDFPMVKGQSSVVLRFDVDADGQLNDGGVQVYAQHGDPTVIKALIKLTAAFEFFPVYIDNQPIASSAAMRTLIADIDDQGNPIIYDFDLIDTLNLLRERMPALFAAYERDYSSRAPSFSSVCVKQKPKVKYPPGGVRKGMEGDVVLSYWIDTFGDVIPETIQEVERGKFGKLAMAAKRAIKMAQYDPVLIDGKPIMYGPLFYTFKFNIDWGK